MALIDLHHVAIKCRAGTLKQMDRFYSEVLGMNRASRPDLGFPGAWLNLGSTMIHLMEKAYPAEADPWFRRLEYSSAVDHIAIRARGFDEIKERLVRLGADWRQTNLREANIWQLFVLDPSGVIVELNFVITDEPAGSVGPDNTKRYPPIEQ